MAAEWRYHRQYSYQRPGLRARDGLDALRYPALLIPIVWFFPVPST
jgi:hypothetical protein